MPVNPTYPGVYIEELASGVRTISGVATSITAFLGRTRRGPVNEPVTLTSFADFERVFGGLWSESTTSFAVRDFFSNGGGQAVVVRLFRASGNGKAKLVFGSAPDLTLEAASEGLWGNSLTATASLLDPVSAAQVAARMGVEPADLFNLEVTDTATGAVEIHRNVTVRESPRRLDLVLGEDSQLVRVAGTLPTAPPVPNPPGTPVTVTVLATNQGNDGGALTATQYQGSPAGKTGLYALEKTDLFNLLCIPPTAPGVDVPTTVWALAAAYAQTRRAMLLIDPPASWDEAADVVTGIGAIAGPLGSAKKNAAFFFPRLRAANPIKENMIESFAPSGAVAGVFARTDAQRGVWKSPAGLEANLNGAVGLTVPMTDPENGLINPLGVNALRTRPAAGPVVWGSRTLDGDDRLASEWKYIAVRRLALFLEESLYRGTQWVVFEPNDEPLWSQIRLNITSFLQNLFRQGAFQGRTPQQAYFVKVDRDTTTQNDIDRGIVNIVVGFAPLKPAEFVIVKVQQIAGQVQI
jgi:uncharacterized protein